MRETNVFTLLLYTACVTLVLSSCNKQFHDDNYTAYFGGEVTNRTSPYILFCKDAVVIDTIMINKDNTFFVKFDSLAPGLYTFRNEPEYQYVYFDKNDSLMVRVNAADFDESVIFCGRGEEKNNFLMEMYLKYENDKKSAYQVYEANFKDFNKTIDSAYKTKVKFYNTKKEQIGWNDEFDVYAKATLDFNYLAKKEIYPIVHKIRTGVDMRNDIPDSYYAFRDGIDFNNPMLTNFSPFVKYLTYMLDNVALSEDVPSVSEADRALNMNIRKMTIADTLFNNTYIKNTILDNIAFTYLLEDQNIVNNRKFLDTYHKLSTDEGKHNEITKIGNAIQLLKPGNQLPEISLVDTDNNSISSREIIKRKTVLFFWTENLDSHLIAAHKKIMELLQKHPDYDFIAINVDKDQQKWATLLKNYKFPGIRELRAANFEQLKEKWVINKIHRTMIINADGTIANGFVSVFDAEFGNELKY